MLEQIEDAELTKVVKARVGGKTVKEANIKPK